MRAFHLVHVLSHLDQRAGRARNQTDHQTTVWIRGPWSTQPAHESRAPTTHQQPVVDEPGGRRLDLVHQHPPEYQTIEGVQSHIFHFSAQSEYKPELHGAFLPCFCPAHRAGRIEECPYLDYVHANVPKDSNANRKEPQQFLVHRLKRFKTTKPRTRSAEDSDTD